MELQRGSRTLYLTSSLDRVADKRHSPTALPPGMRAGTHCTGGWVGPREILVRCGKPHSHRDSIPGPLSSQHVAIPNELSRPKLFSTLSKYYYDIQVTPHIKHPAYLLFASTRKQSDSNPCYFTKQGSCYFTHQIIIETRLGQECTKGSATMNTKGCC